MRNLVFRPEARHEVLEAQAWYEARAVGLGYEFARALETTVAQVMRHPLAFPSLDGEFRRAALRRFPYILVYHTAATELVVVSCFHVRRRPGAWKQNLLA